MSDTRTMMTQVNWRKAVVVLVGFAAVIALILQVTRRVPPFEPPEEGQLSGWGSVDPELAQELQEILDEGVNLLEVPGLQAFIRMPDGRTWSGTSGTTDLQRENPLRRDHVIRIGSVTKSFTAALIMKLVEGEHLSLDEPVEKWFPDLPAGDEITVRQLLNHSSGIPEIIPKVLMRSIMPSTYWQTDELVALIVEDVPQFTPGSKFGYSNSNYILLGLIVEEVSGKSISEFLHELIIDPLNLEHTYFIPYEATPSQLVIGFDRDLASIPGMLSIGRDNTSWATSAFTSGAMASTAEDLGIFFDQLLIGAMLSPSSMEAMTTFIDTENPGFPEQTGSGLGLMRLSIDGRELIGHVGQFMGSTSIAMHAPHENYTITVISNLSNADLVKVLADLQAEIK